MLIYARILIFAIALFLGTLSLVTGLILYFWPHGPRVGQLIIFGMIKSKWSEMHTWFSLLALFVILIHLIINRSSLRVYLRYLKGQR